MIWAAYMGLPLSLREVGQVLQLSEQKMDEGSALIRYFSVPCKPTAANGGRTRNLPMHDLQKWELFKEYNKRDVEVEIAIQQKLDKFPVPEQVWEEYYRDQIINDRGIGIDMGLVTNAIEIDRITKERLLSDMRALTGLGNPNSTKQLSQWLCENGLETDSLSKKRIEELLTIAPPNLTAVLQLRQQLAKSSVKKFQAMQDAVCEDGRARGMFQFYGANRSGRWAGRIIQLQNLPQNHMKDLDQARELVKQGNYDAISLLYNTQSMLSEMTRTAFVPRKGYKFVISDFSAIEACVLAYIAGEIWRIKVFKNGGDIYCASASQMFHCKVEKNGENGHLRQKGKIAELALGYGGSEGALISMGALDMGLTKEELRPLVKKWRDANPKIVKFWWDVDRCAKKTIKNRITTETNGIKFIYQSGILFVQLPSGRKLSYVKPRIGVNRFGSEAVTYEGIDTSKKWNRIESYGAKLVENIIQAISRDILCYAMATLSDHFIVGHVHDELIIECPEDESVKTICEKMTNVPPWMPGLILRAEGYETKYYKKSS